MLFMHYIYIPLHIQCEFILHIVYSMLHITYSILWGCCEGSGPVGIWAWLTGATIYDDMSASRQSHADIVTLGLGCRV